MQGEETGGSSVGLYALLGLRADFATE